MKLPQWLRRRSRRSPLSCLLRESRSTAQYLFREFSKVFADCTYINVGDDLGFENLRRVKMSYRPALFGEKIILRRLLPE